MENYKLFWFFPIFLLLVTTWFVFAIFDFGPSNEVVVYTARPTLSGKSSLPTELPYNSIVYRVERDFVVSKIGSFVSKYDDCQIFNSDNWECQYDDKSARFGLRDGRHFSVSNTELFPHLSYLESVDDERVINRFEYISLQCQWDITGGPLQVLVCLFRPFSED